MRKNQRKWKGESSKWMNEKRRERGKEEGDSCTKQSLVWE